MIFINKKTFGYLFFKKLWRRCCYLKSIKPMLIFNCSTPLAGKFFHSPNNKNHRKSSNCDYKLKGCPRQDLFATLGMGMGGGHIILLIYYLWMFRFFYNVPPLFDCFRPDMGKICLQTQFQLP